MTAPATVTVVYKRSDAPARELQPGEWSAETASGHPALACRSCGSVQEIDERYRLVDGDRVVPAFSCEDVTCSAYEYVRLEGR